MFLIGFMICISRVITFLAFPSPLHFPDSPGYSNGQFLNFDLVSFTGHSYRSWPTPMLYAFLPNIYWITITQLLLGGFAWFWLILNALSLLSNKKSRILLLVLLIALSSSTVIVQWDTVVLGTSLILSTAVMTVGQILRVYRHSSNKLSLVFLIILLTLLALEKLSNLPLVIGITFSVLLAVFRAFSRKFLTSCLVLMILGLSYSTSVGVNVDRNWGGSYSGTTLLWQLGNQSPTADSLKIFLVSKKNVPQCIYKDAPYVDLNTSIGKILNECQDGKFYVRDDLQRDFIFFALSHPIQIAKLSALGFGAYYTTSSNNYGNAVQIFPPVADLVFFGATQPSLISGQVQDQSEGYSIVNSGQPFWLYVPGIGLLIAGLIASCVNLWKTKDRFIESLLFATPVLLLMQAAITTIFLPSEWVRQLVPYLVPLAALNIISILILAERRKLFQKI
jgi:hypothetical protein